jgi:hypothetical protein
VGEFAVVFTLVWIAWANGGLGTASGEIRADIDPDILSEVLVSPVLARMASGNRDGPDPERTSRGIVALVFAEAQPR